MTIRLSPELARLMLPIDRIERPWTVRQWLRVIRTEYMRERAYRPLWSLEADWEWMSTFLKPLP